MAAGAVRPGLRDERCLSSPCVSMTPTCAISTTTIVTARPAATPGAAAPIGDAPVSLQIPPRWGDDALWLPLGRPLYPSGDGQNRGLDQAWRRRSLKEGRRGSAAAGGGAK